MIKASLIVLLLTCCDAGTTEHVSSYIRQPFGPCMCRQWCEDQKKRCHSPNFTSTSLSCYLVMGSGKTPNYGATDHMLLKVEKYKTQEIPPDYKHVTEDVTKINYTYYHEKRTWNEALRVCQSEGGTLLKLDTETRQHWFTKIQKLIDSMKTVNPWIGLKRNPDNGTWLWTDGTPVKEAKWTNGERTDCHCAIGVNFFNKGRWDGAHCYFQHPFVCEY